MWRIIGQVEREAGKLIKDVEKEKLSLNEAAMLLVIGVGYVHSFYRLQCVSFYTSFLNECTAVPVDMDDVK